MAKWNTYTDDNGNTQIEKIDDAGVKSYVPADENNLDYQEYLAQSDNG